MKEKDMQRAFGKWLMEEGDDCFYHSAVFELKIEKTHRFSFDKVKPHQIDGLNDSQEGLYYKISDSFIADQIRGTRFPTKKPFDCLFLNRCQAFVVIMFYVPRQKKIVYILDIDTFLGAEENHDKKSITYEDAIQIASMDPKSRIVDITEYFRQPAKQTKGEVVSNGAA